MSDSISISISVSIPDSDPVSYLQSAITCSKNEALAAFNMEVTINKQWHEIGEYTYSWEYFSECDNNHSVNFLLLLAAIYGEI